MNTPLTFPLDHGDLELNFYDLDPCEFTLWLCYMKIGLFVKACKKIPVVCAFFLIRAIILMFS